MDSDSETSNERVSQNKRGHEAMKYPILKRCFEIGDRVKSTRTYVCKGEGCSYSIKTGHPNLPLNHLKRCKASNADLISEVNTLIVKETPKRRRGESSQDFNRRQSSTKRAEYFLKKLTNMIVTTNLPLSFIDAKVVADFFEEFVPDYEKPSRFHLSTV